MGSAPGIISLITGILAIVTLPLSFMLSLISMYSYYNMGTYILYASIALGATAITLGIIAITKDAGRGMGIAGLIMGAIGLIGGISLIILPSIISGMYSGSSYYSYY